MNAFRQRFSGKLTDSNKARTRAHMAETWRNTFYAADGGGQDGVAMGSGTDEEESGRIGGGRRGDGRSGGEKRRLRESKGRAEAKGRVDSDAATGDDDADFERGRGAQVRVWTFDGSVTSLRYREAGAGEDSIDLRQRPPPKTASGGSLASSSALKTTPKTARPVPSSTQRNKGGARRGRR